MRFLIDANLPRAAIDVCQKFGHQVEFARDIGMAAAPDEQIAARARESGAALLTRDLDFADVRRYPPDQYQGIVVLRLPDTTVAQEIVRVLERFLMDPGFLGQLAGRLAIVEVNRVRFRPPLTLGTEDTTSDVK
jgi:predicted nuclease of predicted toxin-antitoxin system